nr:MAG TPA: tail tape measure protein [Caudoviricetes sp.]
MTIEEIEIIVTAKVEEALQKFKEIAPTIQKSVKQAQEAFSKVDTKVMTNKLHQAVNFMKKKMQDLKKSSRNNELSIKVNNQDAKKQITQIEKEIDSLQKKITGRQMKLNVINPQIDKIVDDTRKSVTPEGINLNDKAMDTTVNNALESNKGFTSLNSQAQKLYTEIEIYNKQLSEAKNKMSQLKQEINQTATTQNKLGSFFSVFKQKTEQVKNNMSNMKNSFKSLPKVTQNIYNNIKGMGAGLKSGLGNVLKYATALFSLRSIYSALSSSANAWLSSQNSQAKQLSANIEYMKYAMGSVFAPVIQHVTNLVYSLMKAVQSLVYAFSGVNIFAKATASSMKNASGSAKQTSKSLSSVHSEINNVSDNKNSNTSGTPNIDLSEVDKTPNKIIDVIRNGNWNEIGKMLGEKLNNAMSKIPWDKIQNTSRNIASGIAKTLNGFIGTTNWNQVGNTFAQGLNTAIYFAYTFVTTFDWKQFGQSIVDGINGFLDNFDWQTCGKTIGDFTKGLLDVIVVFIEQYDFQKFPNKIAECLGNIDWSGVAKRIFEILGAAIIKVSVIGAIINVGTVISNICNSAVEYFRGKIEECGGNVILGILKGIGDAIAGIGQWIYDNVFKPFIDGFKNAFGIHSPSTVMEEQGRFIIEGLKNGLLGIWDKVKQPFIDLKNNITKMFTEIKNNVSNWGNNVKTKVSECWINASNTVREKVTTLRNNISTGLNNAKTTVVNWGSNVKNTFTNLGRNASTWGKDLATNMATGIKNNIHKVTNAVTSVANKIKSFLHFTEPDEGPLSNFHTYMPDMIDLMVKGIKDNVGKVKNEIENLAGTMSYTINTEAVTGIPTTSPTIKPINVEANNMLDTLSNVMAYKGNENDKPIYLTIYVGNAKLGQILLDNLRDMKRQTGKDIEALVGG